MDVVCIMPLVVWIVFDMWVIVSCQSLMNRANGDNEFSSKLVCVPNSFNMPRLASV
jgi:hypothetical protein